MICEPRAEPLDEGLERRALKRTCSACGAVVNWEVDGYISLTGRLHHRRCWRPDHPIVLARRRGARRGGRSLLDKESNRLIGEVERRARERSRLCPNEYDPLHE